MYKLLDSLIQAFFKHQLQIKMYHFQTKNYSGHKASDNYLNKFEKKLDKFMEVGQGIFGKLKISNITLNFNTLNDNTINNELNEFIKLCKSLIFKSSG